MSLYLCVVAMPLFMNKVQLLQQEVSCKVSLSILFLHAKASTMKNIANGNLARTIEQFHIGVGFKGLAIGCLLRWPFNYIKTLVAVF